MGVLRIHFTAQDLARTRVATRLSPSVELVGSLRALQEPQPPLAVRGWRADVHDRLGGRTRLLLGMVLPGAAPDFLDPNPTMTDRKAAAAAVASFPRRYVSAWARGTAAAHPRSTGVRRFTDPDKALMDELGSAVCGHFDAALAPYWSWLCARASADHASRARDMAVGGIDRLLSTLHPCVVWTPPVLRVRVRGGHDFDVVLGGRGLTLQPSVFRTTPAMRYLPEHELAVYGITDVVEGATTPTLIYPARGGMPFPNHSADRSRARPQALAGLIGRSRAAILEALATGPGYTTTELARRLTISPASASGHLGILRDAGLAVSIRDGMSVVHSVTPLGLGLLNEH